MSFYFNFKSRSDKTTSFTYIDIKEEYIWNLYARINVPSDSIYK